MISNDLSNTLGAMEDHFRKDELTRPLFERYLTILNGHARQVGELEKHAVSPAVKGDRDLIDGDKVVSLFGDRK